MSQKSHQLSRGRLSDNSNGSERSSGPLHPPALHPRGCSSEGGPSGAFSPEFKRPESPQGAVRPVPRHPVLPDPSETRAGSPRCGPRAEAGASHVVPSLGFPNWKLGRFASSGFPGMQWGNFLRELFRSLSSLSAVEDLSVSSSHYHPRSHSRAVANDTHTHFFFFSPFLHPVSTES